MSPSEGPVLAAERPDAPELASGPCALSAPSPNPYFRTSTITIYDWDDTLLPSTYLASLGLRVDSLEPQVSPGLLAELDALQDAVIAALRRALEFGKVMVITNAEVGWVELSGGRFMPRVVNFLKNESIKVVSARTSYESFFGEPAMWKTAAFAKEIRECYPGVDPGQVNVLVIGDSLSERHAAHAFAARVPETFVKTVKFVERPSVKQIDMQLKLVISSFSELWEYLGSFDVNMRA